MIALKIRFIKLGNVEWMPKKLQGLYKWDELEKRKSVHCKQKIEKYKEVSNSKDQKNEKKQIAQNKIVKILQRSKKLS